MLNPLTVFVRKPFTDLTGIPFHNIHVNIEQISHLNRTNLDKI